MPPEDEALIRKAQLVGVMIAAAIFIILWGLI